MTLGIRQEFHGSFGARLLVGTSQKTMGNVAVNEEIKMTARMTVLRTILLVLAPKQPHSPEGCTRLGASATTPAEINVVMRS